MRVTVCELPHEPVALASAWSRLCEHTTKHASEFVLLPEFAFIVPLWETASVNPQHWVKAMWTSHHWMQRLPELGAAHVVSTRPATANGQRFNEGFLWSKPRRIAPLRRKFYMPNEPGGWEARWFERGDRVFPRFYADGFSFGLNICSELWALETYGAYASLSLNAVLCPRATGAAGTLKWLAAGTVAAVRSGAYCLSSNRVHPDGTGGGAGWIIDPEGEVLARTSSDAPFSTIDIDCKAAATAQTTYPRYVFA